MKYFLIVALVATFAVSCTCKTEKVEPTETTIVVDSVEVVQDSTVVTE